jgi:hypothetical protein
MAENVVDANGISAPNIELSGLRKVFCVTVQPAVNVFDVKLLSSGIEPMGAVRSDAVTQTSNTFVVGVASTFSALLRKMSGSTGDTEPVMVAE